MFRVVFFKHVIYRFAVKIKSFVIGTIQNACAAYIGFYTQVANHYLKEV